MKSLPLVAAASTALVLLAAPAAGHSISIGSTAAESCFHFAEARARSQSAIDECSGALNDALLSRDDRVATFVNRGIVLMLANRAGDAIRDFDDALKLDAREPEAYLNKGLTELRIGHSAAALALASRALELRTRKPAVAYYVRGLAAEDGGDVRSAYADLRRAAAIDPGWADPATELQRYRVSR